MQQRARSGIQGAVKDVVIVGVDPAAARLDAVVLYPDDSYVLHKRGMPTDIVMRCVTAERWIEGIVKEALKHGRVAVGVEEPVLGLHGRAGANGTLPLAKVHGCLLAAAYRAGATVLPINNQAWKRHIVGMGNAKKPDITRWVRVHWRQLYMDAKGRQDSCDAACIALEVRRVLAFRAKVKATRKRALAMRG